MDTIQVHNRTFRLYMPEADVQAAVKAVADRISSDYEGRNPILCPVLTGSYMFVSDLTRYLRFDPQVSFVKYSSYSGMASTGTVKALLGFPECCRGRDVIIVEDIVDSGISMDFMLRELQKLEPASVAICTFFFKPENFQKDFKVDYIGRSIPNDFILGYGLDYDGLGRTYKDVYVVES